MADRGVITLAYGKQKYLDMAKGLARSLRLHSPSLKRALVTRAENHDDELRELFDDLIPLRSEYGSNARQKIHLDLYSPYEDTIFIDSDCLAVRDIGFIFDTFGDRHFGTLGQQLLRAGDTDQFLDVDFVLERFGIDGVPKFNGGLVYLDKSGTTGKIFESAREILSDWKANGFSEWRNDGPGDERIFSVAMAMHGETMHADEGDMMYTPIGLRGEFDIDVLAGKSTFQKYRTIVSPAVVHFACVWSEHPVYLREMRKLKELEETESFTPETGLANRLKYKFGYQVALTRYILYRIPKKPKYFVAKARQAAYDVSKAFGTAAGARG